MSEITFYRQKRRDGSVRSGLHCGGPYDLESFEPGPTELADDPYANVLDWIIDLQLETAAKPVDAEAGREALLNHSGPISLGLKAMIDEMGVGFDANTPVSWEQFPGLPAGVKCRLNCSISTRYRGADFISILRDFADHWPFYCRHLQVLVHQ